MLVDGPVAQFLSYVADLSISMTVKLGIIVALTPIFILPGVAVTIVGFWCGYIYIRAILSVKREMNNARAPVLAHFGAAITGIGKLSLAMSKLIFS